MVNSELITFSPPSSGKGDILKFPTILSKMDSSLSPIVIELVWYILKQLFMVKKKKKKKANVSIDFFRSAENITKKKIVIIKQ